MDSRSGSYGNCDPSNGTERLTEKFEVLAKRRFDASSYPALRRLTCHCEGNRLVIRGWVPNYYHKQLAQANLSDLTDQIEIVNETQVEPPRFLTQQRTSASKNE